ARDAQRDVDARVDGLAGLADLVVAGQPALVGDGTGSAHDAAQHAGQFLGQGDALLDVGADAAADGNDDVGADEVDEFLGALLDVEDLDVDVVGSQLGGDLLDDDLGRGGLVKRLGLHDAGADGGHLRAEARADDGGREEAADGGTG